MTRTDRERLEAPCPRYRSLASFYTADPRRIHSRELDIGLLWREDACDPPYRAAWVSDTGELYLVRLGPPEQGGGQVEVLATVVDRERLESVLDGWREQCGAPRSLTWLRDRADRLRAPDKKIGTPGYAPGHGAGPIEDRWDLRSSPRDGLHVLPARAAPSRVAQLGPCTPRPHRLFC